MEHELMETAVACAVAGLRNARDGQNAYDAAYSRAHRVFQYAYGYSAKELARIAAITAKNRYEKRRKQQKRKENSTE